MRVHTRYLVEVVEAFNFCPFAEGARKTAALERRVILDEDPLAAALAAVDEFEPLARVAVAILIFPRHTAGADDFERFVGELRDADGKRRARKHGPFAFAPFHPDAPWGSESPERLVMFLRRSPDPSVQLVRFSALDAVRSPAPGGKFLFDGSAAGMAELERRAQAVPISEKIARDNFATVEKNGIEKIQAVLRDIKEDRARTYARFGLK
ncbi:MAG TPA: DUF1415 family protein [Polyangia bacterium]|nr:DUF1415 family protein [Polyangia bacterium]